MTVTVSVLGQELCRQAEPSFVGHSDSHGDHATEWHCHSDSQPEPRRTIDHKTTQAASQLGPLALPGPEAAVEIVIAECSAILLWPF